MVHLAGSKHPGRHDEDGHHQHGEDVLRVQRHHGLKYKLKIEVDSVECTETLRRRIREESAVQHQNTAQQVEPETENRATFYNLNDLLNLLESCSERVFSSENLLIVIRTSSDSFLHVIYFQIIFPFLSFVIDLITFNFSKCSNA